MNPQDLRDHAALLLAGATEDEKQVRALLTRIRAARKAARQLVDVAGALATLQPAEDAGFLGLPVEESQQ